MKRLFTLLSLALVFAACSKDDAPRANKFTVGGTGHDVLYVVVQNGGDHNGDYQGNNTFILFIANDGSQLYFDACSTSSDGIDKRTYNFSNDAPYAKGTFTPNSGWGNVDGFAHFTQGKLTVISRSDNQYAIEFSCTDGNGNKVTGYYRGAVAFQDNQPAQ